MVTKKAPPVAKKAAPVAKKAAPVAKKATPVAKKAAVPKIAEVEALEIPFHPPEIEESAPTTEPVETPREPPVEPPKEVKETVDKEKLLSFIEDIIDTLTFKRVGLIALLVVIGLVLFALFENRSDLVNRIIGPRAAAQQEIITAWELSDKSKEMLQTLAKDTAVSFVAVTNVDLKKNRRTVRYYFIDNPTLKLEPSALRAISLPQAVFDYDPKNTAQMVSILTNEFRCDNFSDTIYFRYAPELAEKMPSICRIAVPPFVGQFAGFMTVGLDKVVQKSEFDTIRLEVSRIAVEIYLNDVIKKPSADR